MLALRAQTTALAREKRALSEQLDEARAGNLQGASVADQLQGAEGEQRLAGARERSLQAELE